MTALFLLSFIVGLLLGVYAMLHGVERRTPGASELVAPPSPRELSARLNVPAITGFLVVFGAVGYPVMRRTTLGPGAVLLIAAASGALGAVAAVLLVAKWAVPSAREDVVDERYLLQGHFARVTAPVSAERQGEVAYEIEGRHFTARAASLDGSPLAAGTDVVIERIENGVVWVEAWAHVEKRI